MSYAPSHLRSAMWALTSMTVLLSLKLVISDSEYGVRRSLRRVKAGSSWIRWHPWIYVIFCNDQLAQVTSILVMSLDSCPSLLSSTLKGQLPLYQIIWNQLSKQLPPCSTNISCFEKLVIIPVWLTVSPSVYILHSLRLQWDSLFGAHGRCCHHGARLTKKCCELQEREAEVPLQAPED